MSDSPNDIKETIYVQHTKLNPELLANASIEELEAMVVVMEDRFVHSHPSYIAIDKENRQYRRGLVSLFNDIEGQIHSLPTGRKWSVQISALRGVRDSVYRLMNKDHLDN